MTHQDPEVSVIVAETVSDAVETPIEELPPLSDVIDLDAFDAVVASSETGESPDFSVGFTYAGVRVVVLSQRTVYAGPIGRDGESHLVHGVR